jgi:GH15 family glucan-1,4-alpha-glucosidase
MAALAGPTGLFSEQFDPDTGLALGNYPQAYSHLGLINAAVRLSADS